MKNTMKYTVGAIVALLVSVTSASAQSADELNDLEIAHVAYTADNIDIRYAHLALAISNNPKVREFAETMIRDHSAINERALALLQKLDVQPQDNFLSQALLQQADENVAAMQKLTGSEFDRRYTENELGYHEAVNELVAGTFIPNIENAEVKALFQDALIIFQAHETLAGIAESVVAAR
ncbi:MAG: DUF4142 domain-containing protein [Gemmatimonadota bacterium]